MATRKKKSEAVVIDMPGTTGSAKIMLPKVEKGSHLTVTTYPDGRTELQWDDEALTRDVRAAILTAESTMPVAKKTSTRKKKTGS
jgi:hypothetical protein